MKLLYGTHNPAKLDAMRTRLAPLGFTIIGLEEIKDQLPEGCELEEIPETGSTPLENARIKALGYYRALRMPVFSCDSGLYIENLPEELQPGIHVRTVQGKVLTDDEMVKYYTGLALQYGDLKAHYRNAVCLVIDEGHIYEAMDKSMESQEFLLTSEPHPIRRKGFPLDSISVDLKTGKFFYDLEEEAVNRVAVEEGFLQFFRSIKQKTDRQGL